MQTEPNQTLSQALWSMDFAKRQLEGYLDGFEGHAWVAQPCEGANHALWQVGHLTIAYNHFASKFGDIEPLEDKWNTLFGMGTEPNSDINVYPPPSEVLDTMWSQRQKLVDNMAATPPDTLDSEWPTEGFIRTPAQMMAFTPIHDATHAGQLAMIRKHLKMERVFG